MQEKKQNFEIIKQLERAAQTLRSLPNSQMGRHRQLRSSWIEMPGSGSSGAKEKWRFRADGRDIDRMYALLDRLMVQPDLERKLLWARAHRIPWALLQNQTGRSRTHLYLIYQRGLVTLAGACEV